VKERLDPETLSEILGLLAHDLRNPLSALQSNVGFLGSLIGDSDPDAQDAVSDAVLSCEGLTHIIDSVEILAHELGEPLILEKSTFAIGALISGVVDRCKSLAASHEVSLALEETAGSSSQHACAHREMTSRSLAALIRNSIQHAPVGSTIRVGLRTSDDSCIVTVVDDGQALAPEFIEEAFSASGQTRTKSLGAGRYSRGLGLFCAKVCAESAGARVGVGRAIESGNVFELTLPSRL
jgi:two-component system CheB/CheR fusion protein